MANGSCGVLSVGQVLLVDEPNMCEYVMTMTTPAACDLEYSAELRLELEEEGDEGLEPGTFQLEL